MKHLPNALSILRILLAPVACVFIWGGYNKQAIWTIAAAGLTDGLDGFLARRLNASSRLGEILDPIADKILAASVFLTLVLHHSIEPWVAAIVLGRDATILTVAGAILVSSEGPPKRFPPTLWGKVSTASQILYVCALLAAAVGQLPQVVMEGFKGAAVVFTVYSGIDYARRVQL